MNGERAPIDRNTFRRLVPGAEAEVALPPEFDVDEIDAIIDRALESTRRVADQVERGRRHAVESARAGAQGSSGRSAGITEPTAVISDRELGAYASGPPPAFAPPPPVVPKWQATHVIPADGLPAWRDPNPHAPPTTNLPAHLEVRVLQEARGWAKVKSAVGRTWWVDAARLVQIRGPRR